MLTDLDDLLGDFDAAAHVAEVQGWPCDVTTARLGAPHRPPALPSGYGAVYAFALSQDAGQRAPAGPGAVLKVGRVGPNSAARFSAQHYSSRSAGSSLAKSLLRYRVMWPWLGISDLEETTVKSWMTSNLDRAHWFVPAGRQEVLSELEVYIRARVGSVFEGAA